MTTRRERYSNVRLRAVRPNAGIKEAYSKRLQALVKKMAKDVASEISELYEKNESKIAQDSTPADKLQRMIDRLRKKWQRRADEYSETTAKWFVNKTRVHVDRSQNSAIRDAGVRGFDIRFDKGQISQDAFNALVNANVSLIKSISSQYLNDVEGIVMRSITDGRDVFGLKKELGKRYDITMRRADFIARDQSNKATEGLARANDLEVGVEQGEWVHIPGKYTSRETHRNMHGKKFDLTKGLYDKDVGQFILPGHLPGCFTGDSKISDLAGLQKVYRRFYSGKLATLITDDGTILNGTPNHPILTREGWKPLGLLNARDYVFKRFVTDSSPVFELDSYDAETSIANLFESLSNFGVRPLIFAGGTGQFHGDGTNSNVEAIDIDSFLLGVDDTNIVEKGRQFGLSRAELSCTSRLFSEGRPFDPCLVRKLCALGDGMSFFCDRLAIFLGALTKPELLRFCIGAPLYSSFQENSLDCLTRTTKVQGNCLLGLSVAIKGKDFLLGKLKPRASELVSKGYGNTGLLQLSADDVGMVPETLSYRDESFTPRYGFCRVSNLVISNAWHGYVYNLQTMSNWYIANYTAVHNCQCTYRPIFTRKTWQKNS